MSGVGDAAAAILAAQPAVGMFPAVGVLNRLTITRGPDHIGVITSITDITVQMFGALYNCGYSGAFLAEVMAVTDDLDGGQGFVGRQVKVELIGGDLIVAYTLNFGAETT